MRTLENVENERVEVNKQLDLANDNYHAVEDEILQLQSQIIGLQQKKKDLEIILNKATANCKKLRLQSKALENEFWGMKR